MHALSGLVLNLRLCLLIQALQKLRVNRLFVESGEGFILHRLGLQLILFGHDAAPVSELGQVLYGLVSHAGLLLQRLHVGGDELAGLDVHGRLVLVQVVARCCRCGFLGHRGFALCLAILQRRDGVCRALLTQGFQRCQIRLLGRVPLRFDTLGFSLQPGFAPKFLRSSKFERGPLLGFRHRNHVLNYALIGTGCGELVTFVLKHHAVRVLRVELAVHLGVRLSDAARHDVISALKLFARALHFKRVQALASLLLFTRLAAAQVVFELVLQALVDGGGLLTRGNDRLGLFALGRCRVEGRQIDRDILFLVLLHAGVQLRRCGLQCRVIR